MEKKKKVLTAGGDMRQIYCAERLRAEYDIYTIGIDSKYIPDTFDLSAVDEKFAGKFDCAVLPVPPPDERGNISAPLFSGELKAAEVRSMLSENAVIFSGIESFRLAEYFPYHRIISYMEQEELTIKNAVSTAEGAVMIALEELPVTLNGLSVLIAGLGRIGTALSLILKGFGADVTAAVHNEKGAAKAGLLGIKSVYTEDADGKYGLVFNTVPKLIFTGNMLQRFPENTLFIDLASRPGGFDSEAAEKSGQRVLQALGLPGKTAPMTAGRATAETIINLLNTNFHLT